MIKVSGTYVNGRITLDEPVSFDGPRKVWVTFIDEDVVEKKKPLSFDDFSFAESQELLKNVKTSLAEEVIKERRRGRF